MPIPISGAVGSFSSTGVGSVAVAGTSLLLNTLTPESGSSGFPTTQTVVTLKSQLGSAPAYFNPFGVATTGSWQINSGDIVSFNLLKPQLAQLLSSGTSTITALW